MIVEFVAPPVTAKQVTSRKKYLWFFLGRGHGC